MEKGFGSFPQFQATVLDKHNQTCFVLAFSIHRFELFSAAIHLTDNWSLATEFNEHWFISTLLVNLLSTPIVIHSWSPGLEPS